MFHSELVALENNENLILSKKANCCYGRKIEVHSAKNKSWISTEQNTDKESMKTCEERFHHYKKQTGNNNMNQVSESLVIDRLHGGLGATKGKLELQRGSHLKRIKRKRKKSILSSSFPDKFNQLQISSKVHESEISVDPEQTEKSLENNSTALHGNTKLSHSTENSIAWMENNCVNRKDTTHDKTAFHFTFTPDSNLVEPQCAENFLKNRQNIDSDKTSFFNSLKKLPGNEILNFKVDNWENKIQNKRLSKLIEIDGIKYHLSMGECC